MITRTSVTGPGEDMEAALYRMEAGSGQMTNCFPARSLFRTSGGGAGHWSVSQKPAQEERFRALVCSASSEEKRRLEAGDPPYRSRSCPSQRAPRPPQHVLDSSFLIKTHHARSASDLCAVDVSDKNLTEARAEEFLHFTSVAYINAAENALALESFRTFLALRELELSMNRIRRIRIKQGDFPHLQVLDLSYNCLSPDDITQLGVLPRLRVLYLTGNELTRLPPDLTAPPCLDASAAMFPSLEILMLDDNKLSHPAVFGSLARLKSLRVLNLDNNGIWAVPYLHQSEGGSSGMAVQGSPIAGESLEVRGDGLSHGTEEERLDYMVLSSSKDPDRTEVIFPSISSALSRDPLTRPPETTSGSSNLPSVLLSSTEEVLRSFLPPLPSLSTLSLAHNKITREEDLLAAALFPSLEELVIYGNPMSTRRRGDPRLLNSFLQQRLGVKITRKKMPEAAKPQLIIPIREERKVRTHVPKIPKQPLMIEPPPHPILGLPIRHSDITDHMTSSSPLPPIRSSAEKPTDAPLGRSQESLSSSEASEEELSLGSEPAAESFFMTQVEDLPSSLQCGSPLPTPEEQDGEKPESREIPERFQGYEELYRVEADPDFIEPVGIQSNVRALQQALKHLLLYQDYRPAPQSVLRPRAPVRSQPEKELRPIPWRSKKELLADALTSMRERRHLVEVPLEDALQDRASRDHQEAKHLLKELHHKYQFFHAQAAKRAAELEADLRDTAKELLQAQGKMDDTHKVIYGNRKGS
ncbi:X-ray radiation resistance-associated protein 1 [Gastrophryne carolinensis]